MSLLSILQTIPCTEVYVPSEDLITAAPSDTLTDAFHKLCQNKILALPVVDANKNPKGTLSIIDVISHLSDKFDEGSVEGSVKHTGDFFALLEAKKDMTDAKVKSVSELGELDPVVILDESKSLKDVVDALSIRQARRVVIQDQKTFKIKGLISQGELVKYLWDNRTSKIVSGFWDRKLTDLPDIAEHKKVITIKLSTIAYKAFRKMRFLGVSGLGVVDDSGKLVGNISASDVKMLGFDLHFFQSLAFTTNEYLETLHKLQGKSGLGEVVCIKESGGHTVGDVTKMLIENHIHRLYIVDSNGKPTGVISVTDILLAMDKTMQDASL